MIPEHAVFADFYGGPFKVTGDHVEFGAVQTRIWSSASMSESWSVSRSVSGSGSDSWLRSMSESGFGDDS